MQRVPERQQNGNTVRRAGIERGVSYFCIFPVTRESTTGMCKEDLQQIRSSGGARRNHHRRIKLPLFVPLRAMSRRCHMGTGSTPQSRKCLHM